MPIVDIPGQNRRIQVPKGTSLLDGLKQAGVYPDAPCGGNGQCGKCKVLVNGTPVLSCKTVVDRDMTVAVPQAEALQVLQEGICQEPTLDPQQAGHLLAFDIGTTSVVCFLLDGKTGRELAASSMRNPQVAFGADVISRIQAALRGELRQLTGLIRKAMTDLIEDVCDRAAVSAEAIGVVSVVGNPAMQQLFLGISPENLSAVPFAPVLKEAKTLSCKDILPLCPQAKLLIVPNIAGFVGADTLGCLLATRLFDSDALTLLVDIGTNGEMVLGNQHRMIACATAAGPALEGANISMGMRAEAGAIDHVWLENGKLCCSTIGGAMATGICGSGLVDAVAVGLKLGIINKRGRILTEDHVFALTETVHLTQEDIRQVQLAKGAICAGIMLMAQQLGVPVSDIQKVQLAGAFGSFLNPENACRIGLLPEELANKIEAVGNAAGSGAKLLACNNAYLSVTQDLVEKVEFLELASLPAFPKTFAKSMLFREEDPLAQWMETAKVLGFDVAAQIDPRTLVAREDVRAMCQQDKCGAYGKNWTGPPAVGTLEDCQAQMRAYKHGMLLQTVGHMTKTIDSKCYRETERRHSQQLYALTEEIRKVYPHALCLGAGGCRVCKNCAYPTSCRFPQKAVSSLEGYGLFVTQVCRDAKIPYYHGEKTITYTGLILF